MTREELEALAWRVVTEDFAARPTNGERASHLADVFEEVQDLAAQMTLDMLNAVVSRPKM